MKKAFPVEFVYQVFALLIAIIIVHAVYVAVIRPNAQAFMEQELAQLEKDPNYITQRSFYVLVRDFEQESCFVLMLWAFAIMGFKGTNIHRQQLLLDDELIPLEEGKSIDPEGSRELACQLESMPPKRREYLLPRALVSALHRYDATRDIHAVSTTAREICLSEGERLESELSLIRYIAWAIPSIGFIGTVRGIGDALAQAHRAVEGDITGVTSSLGVAFNSTFIALIISIILMFFVHQLQLMQERLVLDTESYCDRQLIRHLHSPARASTGTPSS